MSRPKKLVTRWLRFSMRTLALLVTLSAIASAGFYHQYNQAKSRSAAVEHLQTYPGMVNTEREELARRKLVPTRDQEPDPLRLWLTEHFEVDFLNDTHRVCLEGRREFSDGDLEMACRLTELSMLRLGRTQITDEGFQSVAKLKRLELLSLSSPNLTDRSMETIAKLKSLKTLVLFEVPISDEGILRLTANHSLETLNLRKTNVSADAVETLRKRMPECKITYKPN